MKQGGGDDNIEQFDVHPTNVPLKCWYYSTRQSTLTSVLHEQDLTLNYQTLPDKCNVHEKTTLF